MTYLIFPPMFWNYYKWTCISISLFQSTDHSKRFTTLDTFTHSHTHSYTHGCRARRTAHQEEFWGSVSCSRTLRHAASESQVSNQWPPNTKGLVLPPELQRPPNYYHPCLVAGSLVFFSVAPRKFLCFLARYQHQLNIGGLVWRLVSHSVALQWSKPPQGS